MQEESGWKGLDQGVEGGEKEVQAGDKQARQPIFQSIFGAFSPLKCGTFWASLTIREDNLDITIGIK